MDLHSRLQSVGSTDATRREDAERAPVKLDPRHAAFFDRTRIRDALAAHKQRMGWHNLVVRPETVDRLLDDDRWYVLHAPAARLQVERFEDVHALEGVAVDLITAYAAESGDGNAAAGSATVSRSPRSKKTTRTTSASTGCRSTPPRAP